MTDTYTGLNPAAIQRRIQALTAELLTLTISKATARTKPPVGATPPPGSAAEPGRLDPAPARRAAS